MSAWGVRLNPWSTSYSSLEAEQMRFIHKAYCESMECGEEDLPIQLKMDPDKFYPTYRPTPTDFDEHSFMRKMQDVVGLLRNPAEGIISTICAYQRERFERFSFIGYLNDPRTLLLEEFKDWAMRTLAPATCTTESILNDVRRRHTYILRLQHGQQGLFHSGSGERSLIGTLKDVRNVIETRVLPTIEAERAHSSAREQLQTLEARGIDGLMHGVQFLFYVLRNTPNTPADCTISNLRIQQHSGMKDAMQTKAGQMLQVLLTTNSFKTLFPEGPTYQRDRIHSLQITDEEEAELNSTAVFCDEQAQPVIPTVLTRNSRRSSALDQTKPNTLTAVDYLTQSNSGVVALRSDTIVTAYETFTRIHGLLKLLADLLVSCRKARQLAGPGGDLLVYGPGGQEVRRLMTSLEGVQAEISKLVSSLTQIGVRELDQLKPNQERAWRWSFSKVLPLENYIAHDFGACMEPIQRIKANADPVYVQKLYKQFRESTGLWVKENSSICRHVFATLGTAYIENVPGPRFEMLEENTLPELGDGHANTSNGTSLLALPPPDETNEESSGKNETLAMEVYQKKNHTRRSAEQLRSEDDHKKAHRNTTGKYPTVHDSSTSLLSSAANLMSWAVGGKKGEFIQKTNFTTEDSLSPHGSDTADDDTPVVERTVLSSDSSSNSVVSGKGSGIGVMDVLLLVRQSVQRIGQLSWGVRTSTHTCIIEEGDFDAFIVLCSIYDTLRVSCYSDLLIRMRRHSMQLSQNLRKYLTCTRNCILVLHHRLVNEEKCLLGLLSVYRRLDAILSAFDRDLDILMTNYKQLLTDCINMRDGIRLAMPQLQKDADREYVASTMGGRAANVAVESFNAVVTRFGAMNQSPSTAILTHGEYMAQMSAQMDLHQNSLSHLVQNLKGTLGIVVNVVDRLKDSTKENQNAIVPNQQIDYIFEYNYEGFFRQISADLKSLIDFL